MPELPEVETIKIGLQSIVGRSIAGLEVLNAKSFQGETSRVVTKKITGVWRRAKMLGIDLDGDDFLLFHLKMSGQLIYLGKNKFIGGHPTLDMKSVMPVKSTRVIFTFDDGSKLFFNDQRKFGWVRLLTEKPFENLGPEPLEDGFTWKKLKEVLSKRKNTPIKVAVMDPAVVAGVGNIYACEALFLAKINPRNKVSVVLKSDEAVKALHNGIRKSLLDGIKYGGSTRVNFVNAKGDRGLFLDYANVYSRQNLPCKVCTNPIQKIKLGGRGTFFCSFCQEEG